MRAAPFCTYIMRSRSTVTEVADYAISAVRYGSDRSIVHKLRVHRVHAGVVQPPLEVFRAQLVAAIEHGRTFTSMALNGGRYSAVAPVRLVLVQGRPYLRNDGDEGESDCLTGVSEF